MDTVNLLGQLADCDETDPARRELFIVEGDLAGESCRIGRDRRTQAILPFSSEKASHGDLLAERERIEKMLSRSDIEYLMSVLGGGGGQDHFAFEKLRYHKVVFLCDDHLEFSLLRLVLLTFFPSSVSST